MSKLVEQSTANLRTLIIEAHWKSNHRRVNCPSEPIPDFTIEVPADRSHGDWAANVAMVSAKAFKLAPRKLRKLSLPILYWTTPILNHVKLQDPVSKFLFKRAILCRRCKRSHR